MLNMQWKITKQLKNVTHLVHMWDLSNMAIAKVNKHLDIGVKTMGLKGLTFMVHVTWCLGELIHIGWNGSNEDKTLG